jgi:hypothetical protein
LRKDLATAMVVYIIRRAERRGEVVHRASVWSYRLYRAVWRVMLQILTVVEESALLSMVPFCEMYCFVEMLYKSESDLIPMTPKKASRKYTADL